MMILLAEQAATQGHNTGASNQGAAAAAAALVLGGQQHLESQHQPHNHQLKQSHFNLAPPPPTPAPSQQPPLQQQQQHYLTIEELKLALNSCWLCGCNWQADHVSLDCPECGGYALSRPCPTCDGRCKQTWRRNIKDTHDRHRAAWSGQCDIVQPHDTRSTIRAAKQNCFELGGIQIRPSTSRNIISGLNKQAAPIETTNTSATLSPRMTTTSANTTPTSLLLPASSSSCCSSHPSSAASSDSEESYDDMLMMNKR